MRNLEDKALLLLVASVTLIFAWVLWPFSGAILWAAILAVLFAPLHRRILRSVPKMAEFCCHNNAAHHLIDWSCYPWPPSLTQRPERRAACTKTFAPAN